MFDIWYLGLCMYPLICSDSRASLIDSSFLNCDHNMAEKLSVTAIFEFLHWLMFDQLFDFLLNSFLQLVIVWVFACPYVVLL